MCDLPSISGAIVSGKKNGIWKQITSSMSLNRFSRIGLPLRGTSSLGVTGFTTPRGSPSLGEYGCPNPEVPRDLYSLPVYPPLCLLLSADPFHPSTASEGALHEKLSPLCLLPASHGSQKPHVLAVRGDPLDGWCTVGPRCINSAGILTIWLVC
ncbi:hypothetical protein AVEN_116881-1 [Araneus ventricosus]|uniref:Uncharacterized protein n=1 Tax=Araneus ventricosus TaxID=182803 RepID=A0A4Y2QIG8_ARAVE|nr:hypothetical protein AVEN_116881-1 [Araneus ventricosus]